MSDVCLLTTFTIFILVTGLTACFGPECIYKPYFDNHIIIMTHKLIVEREREREREGEIQPLLITTQPL
jgi:hypothetical protein